MKIPARAFIGAIFVLGFFFIFSNSRFAEVNRLRHTPAEMSANAQTLFEASPLGNYPLKSGTEVDVDSDLQHYAQKYMRNVESAADLPLTQWQFIWRGEIETENGEEKNAAFHAIYDAGGNLIEYKVTSPLAKDTTILNDAEAGNAVLAFLHESKIDTSALTQVDKTVSREAGVVKYGFKFEQPTPLSKALLEKISVVIVGATITEYEREIIIDKQKFTFPGYEDVGEVVINGGMAIIWILIGINLIIAFFHRLRRDEIDFSRAKKIGIVLFSVFALTMVFRLWQEWAEMAAIIVFGGAFVGAGALLLFGVVDAVLREQWSEKLQVLDLVFRGHFRVREVGKSMLDVVFLLGASLAIIGAGLWLFEKANSGFLHLDSHTLRGLQSPFMLLGQLLNKSVQTFFTALILLVFWPAILHGKIKRLNLFRLLMTLSLFFGAMSMMFIRPAFWSALFLLPLYLLWTEIVRRFDLWTVFVTFTLIYMMADVAAAFSLQPAGEGGTPMIFVGTGLVAFCGLGFFFYRSPRTARDIGKYVPEYVNRIAEQQRILKELEIARRIQLQFLPREDPDIPGMEIASICIPAMEVGGDYFDFFYEDDRYMNIIIGDVSGKGVSAAFYMTMAKGIIKTVVKRIRAPKLALSEMNAVFYENSPREVFISAIFGLFDMQTRELTFARAGHNPLVVRKSLKGQAEFLKPGGLAIGLDRGGVFSKTIEESTLKIEAGDIFVFYTDGLSEAMDADGEEFGEERLTHIVNANPTLSAKALVEKIKAEVDKFANGARQHDDFTMVVVKIPEESVKPLQPDAAQESLLTG